MRLPEIVIQQQALQYLSLPLKTTTTKTSSALTGPIPSVVPSGPVSLSMNSAQYFRKNWDDNCDSRAYEDESKLSKGASESWPSLIEGSATIYKDFGNGLCFCNTNLPTDPCGCPYDYTDRDSDLEKDIVSEDILMELLQDLEMPDSKKPSELDIEMVDLGDLTDFLDHLGKE